MLCSVVVLLLASLTRASIDSTQDRYIVVLNSDSRSGGDVLEEHLRDVRSLMTRSRMASFRAAGNITADVEGAFRHIYRDTLVGYAGTFSRDVIARIRQMQEVELVERDGTMYTLELARQNSPPWGLARISHREKFLPVNVPDYLYDSDMAGKGVTVYIVDTGINIEHEEFGKRARWGTTVSPGGATTDDNGHGTHVAGIIGSAAYGVAKGADLVAVKVLNAEGSGSNSDIIAGINWVVSDAKANPGSKGSIVNMSLGGTYSQAINSAVDQAVASGVGFIVAAGNDNADACNYSPASSPSVMSVGATNIFDKRASFSNWGKCVTLFAPGEEIVSSFIGSTVSTKTLSGTSMASPHIAGLAAYYMSSASQPLSPKEIYTRVMETATKNILLSLGPDSPNVIAYNSIS